MKNVTRRQRLRSISKWGGVAAILFLVAVWSLSRWRMIAVTPNPMSPNPDTCMLLAHSGIVTYRPQDGPWFHEFLSLIDPRVYEGGSWEYHWDWWAWGLAVVQVDRNSHLSVTCPLWFPLVLIALPTTLLFIIDRRPVRPGPCATCTSDIKGNSTCTCPECGKLTINPERA